jgi:hypothetical protein
MRSQLLLIAAIGSLSGCSSNRPAAGGSDWKERIEVNNRTPRIIVQVCTPVSAPGLGIGMITRSRVGGGSETKTWTTTDGQAVYETYAEFPGETLAVTTQPSRKSDIRQVFIPPDDISSTGWSSWYPPAFETTEPNFEWKFFYGHPFQKVSPSKDAPRIRYILMSFNDYLERVRQRRLGQFSEGVPPC